MICRDQNESTRSRVRIGVLCGVSREMLSGKAVVQAPFHRCIIVCTNPLRATIARQQVPSSSFNSDASSKRFQRRRSGGSPRAERAPGRPHAPTPTVPLNHLPRLLSAAVELSFRSKNKSKAASDAKLPGYLLVEGAGELRRTESTCLMLLCQ
jgi:hypothetical protein